MPWHGPISGVTHDIVELCLVVCRLHELIEEHAWKNRTLFTLNIFAQLEHGAKTFASQLTRAWDSSRSLTLPVISLNNQIPYICTSLETMECYLWVTQLRIYQPEEDSQLGQSNQVEIYSGSRSGVAKTVAIGYTQAPGLLYFDLNAISASLRFLTHDGFKARHWTKLATDLQHISNRFLQLIISRFIDLCSHWRCIASLVSRDL